jgi:hypothetical protein
MKRSLLQVGDIVLIDRPPGKAGQSRAFHARVEAIPDATHRIPTCRVMNGATGRLAKEYTFVEDREVKAIVRRNGIPV